MPKLLSHAHHIRRWLSEWIMQTRVFTKERRNETPYQYLRLNSSSSQIFCEHLYLCEVILRRIKIKTCSTGIYMAQEARNRMSVFTSGHWFKSQLEIARSHYNLMASWWPMEWTGAGSHQLPPVVVMCHTSEANSVSCNYGNQSFSFS